MSTFVFMLTFLITRIEYDMSYDKLSGEFITDAVRRALKEDVGAGDITSIAAVGEGIIAEAVLLCKKDGVLAGIDVVKETFRLTDAKISFGILARDGQKIKSGDDIARLKGPARGILTGERTALNFLQHMSGIATLTSRYVDAVKGIDVKILDTRKTTPGLRLLEKYAVRCGGGHNHRMGLYDMIMIKDNHIVASGSITNAINAVKASRTGLKIEVECKNLDEVKEVLDTGGVDRIMLDNMSTAIMKEAVSLVRDSIELEASGGVNLQTVRTIAETGVNYISVGALTHSAPALDISLEIIGSNK